MLRPQVRGALDGLGPAAIAALAPLPGQYPLITRLLDGTSVVVAPAEPEGTYKHVEFVRLRGNQVLIIFVTNTGTVLNKLVEMDEAIPQHELNAFSGYLDQELEHSSLPEVRQRLFERLREEKAGFFRLLEKTYRASREVEERDADKVYIGGASQIFETPEFADVEKMRAIFVAFEETSKLVRILDQCLAQQGLTVIIGSENVLREWQRLSLVMAPYYSGEQLLGTLGVIGPTRMAYERVIPIVDITARLLAKDLEAAMGKPVTVENRAGGGGWLGWGALAAAAPDGYILGYLNVPSMYAGYLDPKIGRKESLDSFTPLMNHVLDYNIWGVKADSPFKSVKDVIDAAKAQLDHLTHACFQVSMYQPYVALAERLNALTPGSFPKKTMFANSGAEAIENAVKVARYVTQRPAVVAFEHAFHGRTYGAMSLSGSKLVHRRGFSPRPQGKVSSMGRTLAHVALTPMKCGDGMFSVRSRTASCPHLAP